MPGYVPAEEQLAHVEAARGELIARRAPPSERFRCRRLSHSTATSSPRGERPAPVGSTGPSRRSTAFSCRGYPHRELTLFDADHLFSAPTSSRGHGRRTPTFDLGDDVLGWALASTGCRGAAVAQSLFPARDEGRAPLLPPGLCGRLRRRSAPCDPGIEGLAANPNFSSAGRPWPRRRVRRLGLFAVQPSS